MQDSAFFGLDTRIHRIRTHQIQTHRYTYAAMKKTYPMTELNFYISDEYDIAFTGGPAFLALPTSPTLCFPVTEFDLSK